MAHLSDVAFQVSELALIEPFAVKLPLSLSRCHASVEQRPLAPLALIPPPRRGRHRFELNQIEELLKARTRHVRRSGTDFQFFFRPSIHRSEVIVAARLGMTMINRRHAKRAFG